MPVLLSLLVCGLPTASGQAVLAPAFTSIEASGGHAAAVLAVPDWVRQITLESRSDIASGTWRRFSWKAVDTAGPVSCELGASETMGFMRARAYEAPSFLERVTTGLGRITDIYPDAVLYEVQAGPGAATTDPTDLAHLRIICGVEEGTAVITSEGGLDFGSVEFVGQPWLGDMPIPWPVVMDVMPAAILLEQAGHAGSFTRFLLRQPVYPGMDEPYYIFGMSTGEFIFVGVTSHCVFAGT